MPDLLPSDVFHNRSWAEGWSSGLGPAGWGSDAVCYLFGVISLGSKNGETNGKEHGK